MRRAISAIAVCGLATLSALASDTLGGWTPISGAHYRIFSGETVAYSEAPRAKDRKLSILLRGQAAKEIFDSIGPDARAQDMCSTSNGDRERAKGAVQCTFTALKASETGMGYRCWVGVDLISGKGIPSVPC